LSAAEAAPAGEGDEPYRIDEATYHKMRAAILEAEPRALLKYEDGRLYWHVGTVGWRTVRKAALLLGIPAMCEACSDEVARRPLFVRPSCGDVRHPPAGDCGKERT
jgi:hypothetical protein